MSKTLKKKLNKKLIEKCSPNKTPEGEEKFRVLFENAKAGIFLMSLGGDILELNKSFAKMHGYTVSEMKRMNLKDLDTPETSKLRLMRMKKVLAGEGVNFEVEQYCKNGKIIPIEVSTNLVKIGGQKYILAFHHNIAERRKIENALKESERKYKELFNDANDAIWLLDGNMFVECNKGAVRLFDCKNLNEIVGHSPIDFSPKRQPDGQESKKKALKVIKLALAGRPQRFYWQHFTKNGKLIDAEISLSRINLKNKFFVQAIGRDITERKRAEEKFKESEYFFKESQKAALIGSYKTDFIKGVWESSEVLDDIFGIQKNYKRNVQGWLDLIYLEDQKMMDKYLSEDVIKKHNLFNKEYRIVRKSDGQVRWVLGLGKISLNKKHQVVSMTGTIQDINDRVEKEKKLEQAKNDFLSLASHQFRTPLSATKWVLESLEDDENFTLKQKDKLNSLVISNERLINLVNDMLDVTKIESGKLTINKKQVDLKVLINDLIVLLKPLINKYKKDIKTILPLNIKNVYCDPVLMSEALKNLLTNAIIYSLEGSQDIILEVKNRTKDYLISVHNDGFIKKTSLGDIKKFEKFVRGQGASDRQPEGSGLGLYITNNILKASGESFWCESNTKFGTSFYLTITKKN